MESHPQNSEFRNNPENFHRCLWDFGFYLDLTPPRRVICWAVKRDCVHVTWFLDLRVTLHEVACSSV